MLNLIKNLSCPVLSNYFIILLINKINPRDGLCYGHRLLRLINEEKTSKCNKHKRTNLNATQNVSRKMDNKLSFNKKIIIDKVKIILI